jgi:hypothetical protein
MSETSHDQIKAAAGVLRSLEQTLTGDAAIRGELVRAIGQGLSDELLQASAVLSSIERRLMNGEDDAATVRSVMLGHEPSITVDERTFAAAVRDEYGDEFRLHYRVAAMLQSTISTERSFPTRVHLAVNLLMTQAFSAHISVGRLAEIGHAGDALTIARRLIELAARAAHIVGPNTPEQDRPVRADEYLGWFWREVPTLTRERLSPEAREPWEAAESALKATGATGYKSWKKIFNEIGHGALYGDYSLLSTIAHGTPVMAPLHHAGDVIPIRDTTFVPAALNASNRFTLAVVLAWNDLFGLIDGEELQRLSADVVEASKGDHNSGAK